MKRKNAIDNLFVTGLFVILISSIIFMICHVLYGIINFIV